VTMLQALRDLFAPRIRRERFFVVTMRVPYGVSPEGGFAARDRLNGLDPDYWLFLNPGTFHAYFRASRSGSSRARACLDALEPLRAVDRSLTDLECTLAEGTLLASFDRRGRAMSMPLGITDRTEPYGVR
jgi:hypothetical protein